MENLNKANLLRLNPDSNSKESARLGSAVSETNLKIERDLMKNKNLNENNEINKLNDSKIKLDDILKE